VEIDSDDMTDNNDLSGFKEIEVLDPEPTKELASLCPDLILGWNELMDLNWNKVRANLQFLGKVVTNCKELYWEGLGFVDQEISSIANKIALLDTCIGTNPTASGIVLVWEAMEDVVFDSRVLEIKFTDVEKQQQAVELVTKDVATKREKVQGKLDALLTNFDALANNYTKNILKLEAKLLALENGKQAQLLKEASAPFPTRVGSNAHNKNYEALHN
jgi:hypothetical protein